MNNIHILMFSVVFVALLQISNATKDEPTAASPRWSSFIRYLRDRGNKRYEYKTCASYMRSCVPDKFQCCGNLMCLNTIGGECLYPIEECVCNRS